MDIQPRHASIELGNIWFGPRMQRTRAATEAIFLALKLAADDLGYRRLIWKCNALNAPSKRAATRLGFSYEGQHRMHMVVKGRQRDTDWYSIVGDEWPRCRDALLAWLDPANFAADGTALRGLAALRTDPTNCKIASGRAAGRCMSETSLLPWRRPHLNVIVLHGIIAARPGMLSADSAAPDHRKEHLPLPAGIR